MMLPEDAEVISNISPAFNGISLMGEHEDDDFSTKYRFSERPTDRFFIFEESVGS